MHRQSQMYYYRGCCNAVGVISARGQVFSDVFQQSLGSSIGSALTITIVNRIKQSGFISSPSGSVTQAKVSITGPVTRCYIGNQGGANAYDATGLTQVFFLGAPGLSQSLGSTFISDPVNFVWSGGDIIVSVEANSLDYNFRAISTGLCDGYYNVGVLQADVADKTGYTGAGATDTAYMVSRVQLDGF